MIAIDGIEKEAIGHHYDLATVFYRLLWGRHIHHGLWHADESPAKAQLQLTQTLAAQAGIEHNDTVLDVGCGMGGSAIYLARNHSCRVTGITLSRVQRLWCSAASRWAGTSGRTQFRRQDAELAEYPDASFDVVWSIECTEHLFDKARFFRRAAAWLKPGGRFAICAWLATEPPHGDEHAHVLRNVCHGMLCPSLGSCSDYVSWFEAAGLEVTLCEDWTARVARTWDICRSRVERAGLRRIAPWIDRDGVQFLDHFQTMQQAYAGGAMKYGCFIARKNA
jgi:tocopherol O-methyltransferase